MNRFRLSLAQDLFTRATIVRKVMSDSNNSDSDVMGSSYSSTDDSSTSGDSAVTVDDEEHEKRCAAMNCALLRKPLSIQRSEVEAMATAMKMPKEEVRSTLLGKALEMWQPPDDMPGHIGKMAKKALAKMTGAASSSQGPAAPPLKDTNSIMKTLANEFKANTIDEKTLENKDAETPTTEDWKTKLPKRISKLVEECEYGIKHPGVLTAKHRLSQKMLKLNNGRGEGVRRVRGQGLSTKAERFSFEDCQGQAQECKRRVVPRDQRRHHRHKKRNVATIPHDSEKGGRLQRPREHRRSASLHPQVLDHGRLVLCQQHDKQGPILLRPPVEGRILRDLVDSPRQDAAEAR